MPRTRKNTTAAMKVKAPGARKSLDKMKYEIANEFGVNLGANASSRENGMVGGEITKRLVESNKSTSSSHTKGRKKTTKRSRKSSK